VPASTNQGHFPKTAFQINSARLSQPGERGRLLRFREPWS